LWPTFSFNLASGDMSNLIRPLDRRLFLLENLLHIFLDLLLWPGPNWFIPDSLEPLHECLQNTMILYTMGVFSTKKSEYSRGGGSIFLQHRAELWGLPIGFADLTVFSSQATWKERTPFLTANIPFTTGSLFTSVDNPQLYAFAATIAESLVQFDLGFFL